MARRSRSRTLSASTTIFYPQAIEPGDFSCGIRANPMIPIDRGRGEGTLPRLLQAGAEVVDQLRVVDERLAQDFGLLLGDGPVLFLDGFG